MAEQMGIATRMAIGGIVWAAIVAWLSDVPAVEGIILAVQIWVPTLLLGIRRYDHAPSAGAADDACL